MKYRKDRYPEAVSQKYCRKQRYGKNKGGTILHKLAPTRAQRKILIKGRKGTPKQKLFFQINVNGSTCKYEEII